MSQEGDRHTQLHNRGEQDRTRGERHVPHGAIECIGDVLGLSNKDVDGDNAAYRKGWENAGKQKK